jgi:hypothetical protein
MVISAVYKQNYNSVGGGRFRAEPGLYILRQGVDVQRRVLSGLDEKL